MATITKVPVKGGFKWKALIRRGNRSRSKTFKLKAAARAWADEIERGEELAIALGSPGAVIPFEQLAEEYLDQYAGKDHSRKYRVKYWADKLGKTKLTDIKADRVADILDEYQASPARGFAGVGPDLKTKSRDLNKTRSVATRNRLEMALSAVLRYAKFKKRYIKGSLITEALTTPAEDNARKRFLSDMERGRLLASCKASAYDKLYMLAITALTSGCRLGEVLNLRWSDVNFEDSTFYLEDSKNGDPRFVPFGKPALEEMKRFRQVGNGLLFPAKRKPGKVFVGFRRHWNKAKKEAGIEDFRFHDCRHSVASDLLNKGFSLAQIGKVLGHKQPSSTNRYAHLSREEAKRIISETYDEVEEDK